MKIEVSEHISKAKKWQNELALLRSYILDCLLTEEYKWKQPCYTFKGKNVVLIHGFKDYCAIMFFKGVLLKDEENILIQQTKNVQETRQIRFKSLKEIEKLESTVKSYIFEAIEVEKAGLKVKLKTLSDFEIPEEFQAKLETDKTLKTAFEKLTPGRRKAYLLFFSGAKQSATRITRIEKYRKRIIDGYGINDCVCGKSKRMPNCDGSHKY